MFIKNLIENNSDNPTLEKEHGLSLYIETRDHKILFDVGQTDAYLRNARKLGVDLQDVDALVVSHGHYDHGGGLRSFLTINKKAKVYVSKGAFGYHYSQKEEGKMTYIGLDLELRHNPRIIEVEDHAKICGCLEILKNKSHAYPRPSFNRFLFKKVNGSYVPDDFSHEQNLMVHCGGKTVLIVGCAHNGILNILDTYESYTGAEPNVIVGGFHLSRGSKNEKEPLTVFNHVIEVLGKKKTEYYTGHCTGLEGYKVLRDGLGDQINYFSAGASIHI